MITSTIKIMAPAEKIWQAITEKNLMKEWYFDIPDFKLQENAVFNFYEPGDKKQFHHRCRILTIQPNKLFSHTWTHPQQSKGLTTVTWELDEKNGITQVTLKHEGIENLEDGGPDFAAENYQMGWDGFMYILKNYINGIRKNTYTMDIKASKEKVWSVLFYDSFYRKWSEVFAPGSHIKGRLEADGNHVHFLDENQNGVYSRVIFWIPQTQVMFQHIGNVVSGIEQEIDLQTEKWSGSFETYSLHETEGKTQLKIEIDFDPTNKDSFDQTFHEALLRIKKMSED